MQKQRLWKSLVLITMLIPHLALANTSTSPTFILHATTSTMGIIALIIFLLAYVLVMSEEVIQLRKSKPVLLAAGLVWVIVAAIAQQKGFGKEMSQALGGYILEYAQLLLFIFVAMTYINVLTDRNIFAALKSWLIHRGFSYQQLFWITGFLTFFISPIADNLTTALIMGAVVITLGQNNARFTLLSCINVVVAANAGGAFTPFGDITTLMVWQNGVLPFMAFFKIFIPALISYIVPALCMAFVLPKGTPQAPIETIQLKVGAKRSVLLFLLTIATAVILYHELLLPPMIGMMLGLAYLQIFSYYLAFKEKKLNRTRSNNPFIYFNIFKHMETIEWDTLLFFYGIILGIGGLATLGYLDSTSNFLYHQLGSNLSTAYQATPANTAVGLLSAIFGNIPIMFSVLTMNPNMPDSQWLLVTLTAGIGGSLLSIGSAAGVALMGQARGIYTFMSHLKWVWAIALGYFASIVVHLWLNSSLM